MADSQLRVYNSEECAVFCKTRDKYGGYSNMCAGYPLVVNDIEIRTSEALYQTLRFPTFEYVQRLIIAQKSPMAAKMKSKPYRKIWNRPDFDMLRVNFMRWCLRVKLFQNWDKYLKLLMASDKMPIVEQSSRDDYWGAKIQPNGTLMGYNILGRLSMELRENLKICQDEMSQNFTILNPIPCKDFLLYGQPIRSIERKT